MPELPEVETIVRELRGRILGVQITEARLLKQDMLKHPAERKLDFGQFLISKRFTSIERRGKFMIFALDDGAKVIGHLGMTGKFVSASDGMPDPNHLCSQYSFSDGSRLDHIDVRRFGRLELYQPDEPMTRLDHIGIDPLDPGFSAEAVKSLVFSRQGNRRKRAIHTVLMDQSLISGVGNIYAAEALFRAGIKPDRFAGRLTKAEQVRLAAALRQVMLDSLKEGGTTVSDYRRIDDKPGNFKNLLNVYERAGKPCRLCGTEIKRIRLGGRSAYYCGTCQKNK
ncbi:bifunctional DNA-formamidopyrimidine glycosylase/DNA-(apurinic or apyrimidinic site) lyase [bacterium]|nr:bifunctional DNA-formamidopyrimidine glycosylase/DNA-(apurinic or apyrimidinic site) lyase [bacterium]MBU1880969.1 bifunctional DNA-formamidopyrimidine glycosylase/DNA-(apurinic or apyrimidinic site) lyase [bacterium]